MCSPTCFSASVQHGFDILTTILTLNILNAILNTCLLLNFYSTFNFDSVIVCEAALLTIKDIATSVKLSTNYVYRNIPPVFLQFTKLKQLILPGGVNCSCAQSKYFYEFAQRVEI